MMASNDKHTGQHLERVELVNYNEEGSRSFVEKAKENPLFPVGIVGFSSLVIYNITKIIRNRNQQQKLPLSLQLIHTRMYAQGFVLGTLSAGVIYMLGTRLYAKMTNQKYQDPFTSRDSSTEAYTDNNGHNNKK